jgi:histidine triad (HIT) family protein
MDDCIFCKIVRREIPTEAVYEDNEVFSFYDINPQAPKHILVIPKRHISDIMELSDEDKGLLGEIGMAIKRIAEKEQLSKGFRVIVNCGEDAGCEVLHLHFHILGGRRLGWPPG